MKINNYAFNPQFQKFLKANCHILKNKESYPCSIYELEYDDVGYFDEALKNKDWQKAGYIQNAEKMLEKNLSRTTRMYAMEDNEGNCIAFCEIDKTPHNMDILETLEVRPDYAYKKYQKRKTKYIGETFINFLAQNAIRDGKQGILIYSAISSATKFYHEKCNMKKEKNPFKTEYIMNISKIDKFKEKNKNHTGEEIEFVKHSWIF